MCHLQNIAMRDNQESVTTGQTDRWTDRQTPDKVIPMCRCALQTTQTLTLFSYLSKYFSHMLYTEEVTNAEGYGRQERVP